MNKILLISTMLMYAMLSQQTMAAPKHEEKPFAEQKIVLQITDDDPAKQTLVLNVANNLIKHYGQDQVEVEIVAFGPGLKLLLENNTNSPRIDGLTDGGVRFSACSNTMAKMEKKMGHPPKIHKSAVPVTAGVVRIIDLQGQGYKLIRP